MPRPVAAGLIVLLFAIDAAAQPTGPKKLALLVGVNNYENTGLGSLNHTVRDMEALQDKLKEAQFTTELLRNREATKANIEAALAKLKEKRGAGDLVLIAMSGHGVQMTNSKGEEDAFYCPAGCDKSNVDSLLSLTRLVLGLGNKGVNLVLVDACRDDPRKGFRGIVGNTFKEELPANTAIMFSCSARQQSFETNRMFGESSDRGHGVFFFQVLKGLEGAAADKEGEVTWDTLVSHVKKTVNARAKEWFDDRAKQLANDLGVGLADLQLQNPHSLGNLQAVPVLARVRVPDPTRTPIDPAPTMNPDKDKPMRPKSAIKVGGQAVVKLAGLDETSLIYAKPFGNMKQDDEYRLENKTVVSVIEENPEHGRYLIEWSHKGEKRSGWVDKSILAPRD